MKYLMMTSTVLFLAALAGCGGNVTVEKGTGGAGGTGSGGSGGGTTTVPCDDSVKWTDPPFTLEVDASNADEVGLIFANACLDHDKIAGENNEICAKDGFPPQVPWVYCVSLDNVDHHDVSCVEVEADGGASFSDWAKGLQKTSLCSIFFTKKP